MQPTSIILFLSAFISVSGYPGAFQARQAVASGNPASPKSAEFACAHSSKIVSQQIAQMSKLKAQNISIPPYLAGYYTAINSGRQEIGCQGSISLAQRDTKALKEPCDVVNDQHERMMELVNKFEAEKIPVAPFIAGFLTATEDGHGALSCLPFTGPATEAGLSRTSNSTAFDTST